MLEKEKEFKNQISAKENHIEELKENFESIKYDHDSKHNTELITLRNLHELEKQKIESKHS